jgi:circadian clock protein KaiC
MARSRNNARGERHTTTIPSLDVLLGGGLVRGSTSLVIGPVGSGKTVLGNQIAFGHVAAGGRALYVAHYGETHDRMIANMRGLSFFNADVVGRELSYLNGMRTLGSGGVDGLHQMIAAAIDSHHASLLVVDGLLSAELRTESNVAFQRFVQNLQSHTCMLGCTTLLLSTETPGYEDATGTAHVVVDGLVRLYSQRHGLRVALEVEVQKLRGAAHLTGRHIYDISGNGITIYPRIETIAGSIAPDHATSPMTRASTGIAELDAMCGGGWFRGSTTLLLGAAGSGKTLLGLHFLIEGARVNERGVLVGFYEPPSHLFELARSAGLSLEEYVKRGLIEVAWHPRREQVIDRIGGDLLATVRRTGAQRLFVDSLGGFADASTHPGRMSDFFAALANELRAAQVTSVWSDETHEPQGPDIRLRISNVSAVSENIVLLHCVETPRGLYRIVSLKKVRGSEFDSSMHELWVTTKGIRVAPTSESAIALLEGPQPKRAG